MIDLLDPELHASGEAMRVFRELRAESPVVWCEGRRGPGYWSVVRHAEVVEAARDVEAFSSYWGTRPEVVRPEGAIRPLHNLDPPAHGELRAIAARAVTAERLATLDDAIASFVDDESRTLRAAGDAVRDFAERIPPRVFATWLGFRAEPTTILQHVTAVHTAGAALLDTARTDSAWSHRASAAREATESIARFVGDEIGRAEPGSVLRELDVGLATLFIEAGIPTLIDAIGSTVVDLATHDLAHADVDMLVEELLRRASPIAQFARRATRDVTLGGQRIRAGEQIVLWFVSANHDERVFPGDLVPDRAPNPHVAFGVGPHRCIGATVGRRVLRAVVRALRGFRVAPVAPAERRASSYLRGYVCAPVALEPS